MSSGVSKSSDQPPSRVQPGSEEQRCSTQRIRAPLPRQDCAATMDARLLPWLKPSTASIGACWRREAWMRSMASSKPSYERHVSGSSRLPSFFPPPVGRAYWVSTSLGKNCCTRVTCFPIVGSSSVHLRWPPWKKNSMSGSAARISCESCLLKTPGLPAVPCKQSTRTLRDPAEGAPSPAEAAEAAASSAGTSSALSFNLSDTQPESGPRPRTSL
mmetsp:Transcript_146495/g.469948  ORF Transcript_146495/g.469948 Transcript_146495/m.469948 type:complete len:215 (+) Transcript_146495:288-932(+)